jgi:hypothetical protein
MKTASRAGPAAFLPFDAEIALPDPLRNAQALARQYLTPFILYWLQSIGTAAGDQELLQISFQP